MSRRNFSRAQKEQIVERSKRKGVVYCEGCGLALKPGTWEIDHIIPDGLLPEADKQKPITIAEGQLLGKECCHRGADGKTNRDVKQIAKANRQYGGANGLKTRPVVKLKSAPFPRTEKSLRPSDKIPVPPPRALFREERK